MKISRPPVLDKRLKQFGEHIKRGRQREYVEHEKTFFDIRENPGKT